MSLCLQCAEEHCPHKRLTLQHCVMFRNKDFPTPRGTTAGELTRMHVESENPDHYRNKSIEPIDAMRAWLGDDGFVAYCRGNVIKYLARFGDKDAKLSEAKKAAVYLRWLIEVTEGKELSK